ncbi:amidohydrolase [Acidiphilium sp. C61]|jgi:hippurate hydrolase|uniref:amidohydrolase n=1 Tax=Acidiphilium sp. C61 TaxID=1671485 RepID=UPI00157B5EF6|nr:amidohydrolase [Acidiphilium sp. C61]
MTIDEQLLAWAPEFSAWRRDFHAHPELGYQERRTAALVAERLTAFGLDVTTGVGGTGVVGTLRAGSGNRAIALRADMDALPIEEAGDAPWRSTTPGTMHACGHDGHTTMLLAAARYLAATRRFSGTIHFIFQPAEEGGAGARAMLEDGLLERFPFDSVFGAHNDPLLPIGVVSASPGTVNAASDTLMIRLSGKGGHAARPHQAIDPIVAGAQIVVGLQSLVARHVAPLESAVVSVCTFHAGSATNVIPETATLSGTVRTLTPQVQDQMAREIPVLVRGLAAAAGVGVEVGYERGYPPVVNDPAAASAFAEAARAVVGASQVRTTMPASMGGEDFAFYALERPGCFFRIGQADGARGAVPLHHPRYDFNDAIIPLGAALFAAIAVRELPA